MKLIIDIPEMAYEAFKEWHKNKVATVEQSIIANGKPYEERPQGEWVRKEDVIHSIAKQYSEHNELVPIWLSIGDMKGGVE